MLRRATQRYIYVARKRTPRLMIFIAMPPLYEGRGDTSSADGATADTPLPADLRARRRRYVRCKKLRDFRRCRCWPHIEIAGRLKHFSALTSPLMHAPPGISSISASRPLRWSPFREYRGFYFYRAKISRLASAVMIGE